MIVIETTANSKLGCRLNLIYENSTNLFYFKRYRTLILNYHFNIIKALAIGKDL